MSQSEVVSYWLKNEVSLFFMKRESETKSYKLRTYQLTTEGFLIYSDYHAKVSRYTPMTTRIIFP